MSAAHTTHSPFAATEKSEMAALSWQPTAFTKENRVHFCPWTRYSQDKVSTRGSDAKFGRFLVVPPKHLRLLGAEDLAGLELRYKDGRLFTGTPNMYKLCEESSQTGYFLPLYKNKYGCSLAFIETC